MKKALLVFLSLCGMLAGRCFGQIGSKPIYYGASYYPEAWDTAQIDADIVKMKALHMNVMRLGEFAWALYEPQEGIYKFDWLLKVVRKLGKAGIDVMLGTPSATPPAWMWEKYPEIGEIDVIGVQAKHGIRRNCAFSSSVYQEKTKLVTSRMAKAFAGEKNVIGWQTDNELSIQYDYSARTKALWHQWLAARYGTIDNLNTLWGTVVWSQTYGNFNQIPMPDMNNWYHPSLKMAWVRFSNHLLLDFNQMIATEIRKYADQPITHDGMPSQKVEYGKLFKEMDFVAFNNYHSFEAYDLITSNYDRCRAIKQRAYWLTETAPNYSGGGGSGSTWFLHAPAGSMNAALWMSYAMGGQGAMYWLWRGQHTGQEMTHGAVLQAWGAPSANYADIGALGSKLAELGPYLAANPVDKPQAAIVYDYINLNAITIENFANDINYYRDWTYRFYQPMRAAGIHRDVVDLDADIAGYKLLFIPLAPIITVEQRAKIKAWVEKGGTLILGPMSGYRSEDMTAYISAALGDFEAWTGITGGSLIPIGAKPRPAEPVINLQSIANKADTGRCGLWALNFSCKPPAQAFATYTSGMQNGTNAIATVKVGKGSVVLLGTDPGAAYLKKLLQDNAKSAGIPLLPDAHEGILLIPRGNGKALFAINLKNVTQTLATAPYTFDGYANKNVSYPLSLAPYQVALLKNN